MSEFPAESTEMDSDSDTDDEDSAAPPLWTDGGDNDDDDPPALCAVIEIESPETPEYPAAEEEQLVVA